VNGDLDELGFATGAEAGFAEDLGAPGQVAPDVAGYA
jgi:hypothetical protein